MANGKAEAILAQPGYWRDWLAQAWRFYFAHRPIIVLSMGLYLLLLHITAAWLFWHSSLPGTIAWKLGLGSRWAEFNGFYDGRRSSLQKLVSSLDPGAVLFIGDSQLANLDIGALTDRAVQLSISGETARRVAKRIGRYRTALSEAKLVFIHVGTNDLLYHTPEELGRPLARILRTVPAGIPVILSGPLPVDERRFRYYGNAEIRAANRTIAKACAARSSCSFVDTGAALVDVTGNLDPSYHDGKGLHLNSKGIRVWRTALTTILDPWRSF